MSNRDVWIGTGIVVKVARKVHKEPVLDAEREYLNSMLKHRAGEVLEDAGLRIPRSSGHPFHEHLTTDSTVIRPPIPRASGH
ncbi:hypothetical protein [Pseudomonas aeruginosa]|uniref:hypothetical protein n=1 Tax=Pseudomonas aeruginosa TaxID=287 RepID=UPI002554C899|nr:hypothetical protein [Pseudomonas aeruginosa]